MVSKALVKLSSPVAKSCLVALGIALIIDAVLMIFAASQYPYLIAYTNELHVSHSQTITVLYSCISAAAVLLSLSTGWASYKSKTNYVLVHACITAVFLPVSILVYFSSTSSRYKVSDFVNDYRQMVVDYRLTNQQLKLPEHGTNSISTITDSITETTPASIARSITANNDHQIHNNGGAGIRPTQVKFTSFINIIDTIQKKFACCGIDSKDDWIKQWDNYIPPSCCEVGSHQTTSNENWATLFKYAPTQEFYHCSNESAHELGCLAALKDDEKSKFAWLADLIVFLMVMTITNTIVSLLLFGLSKTEDMPYDMSDNELAMVGVSDKPRPSQPEITGIRHRPSVITMGASKEQIASISQAVRFNLSNSPRASISGPSKFSAAARRGSSFV